MKPFTVLVVTAAAATIACLWDFDTLSVEANKNPDAMGATIGYFDRNPPLYYAMRRDRCLAEPKKNPSFRNYAE